MRSLRVVEDEVGIQASLQFGNRFIILKELPHDKGAVTGYLIINADNIDEAEKIAKGCPIITSMRVYEAMAMH